LETCRKQKIIPATYFVRHLKDSVLTLKHHGLGAPGIRPVSAALSGNTVVTKLDLSDNWLGPKGVEHLTKMLKENCFITHLVKKKKKKHKKK
jgi:Ran GTPase-activating protein (RanGAP) involved in mRNA processing and transport